MTKTWGSFILAKNKVKAQHQMLWLQKYQTLVYALFQRGDGLLIHDQLSSP